ncbi:hypothetical protein LINPERPRIM_LOCUS18331 [Linum perenne]
MHTIEWNAGNGDKNVEVERDSDTSELNSPASEGNPHHQHTFGEGNGEPEKSGPSPDDSVVTENKLEEKEVTAEASRSEEAGQQDVEVKIEEGTKSDQDVKNLETPVASMSQVMEGQLQATQVGDSEVIDIFESGLKASELKSLPKSYPANDVPVLSDSRKNEEVLSTSDPNAEVVVSSVNEDKSLTSSGAVETTVKQNAPGTEPLLASAPRVSQRTSFLNCCGLFDAFTSSDR